MNTLTIRINDNWYAMTGGIVAKGASKTVARTRLHNARAIAQPAPTTREAPWVPVMRISEQIAHEAARRNAEAQVTKEMPA